MYYRSLFALIAMSLLVLTLAACGAATPTPRPTATFAPPPTVQPTPVPTDTPSPTPSPVPSPTPILVQAVAKQDVNARRGPGLEYAIVTRFTRDSKADVLGKNQNGTWLQLAFPDAANPTWVSATFLTVTGPVDRLQVVQVAVAPTPTRGAPAPTRAAAATPTQAFAAARGSLGFIFYEEASRNHILGSIALDSRAVSGFKALGPKPGSFDIRSSTSAAPHVWSPDGSKLAFVFSTAGTEDALKFVNRTSLDDENSVAGHRCISSPVWQDNRFLLYIGMDGSGCTIQKIYRFNTDPGGRREEFSKSVPRPDRQESLRGLAWGPFLLFVSNYSGAQEIWRLNGDGTSPAQLTSDGRENGSPAWSPDGAQFAYYSRQQDGGFHIVVRNTDGSNPRRLTSPGQGNNFSPVWSPDSNWIAFMSDRGGRADIYIMNKNGGQVQLLTDKNAAGGFYPGSWR